MNDNDGEDPVEPEMETIHARVRKWFAAFLLSPQHQLLTKDQKEAAADVVAYLVEYGSGHIGMTPETWDASGLRELCLEVLPRKVTADRAFFEAVAPVLSAFFTFLGKARLLGVRRTLAKSVAGMHHEIVAASQDKCHWGPAKAFTMAALDAGVDIQNEAAMTRFVIDYNRALDAGQRPTARATFPPWSSDPTPAPEPLPASTPERHAGPKVPRNDPCPCGSGKKAKKCCNR